MVYCHLYEEKWISEGTEVRIVTARVASKNADREEARKAIKKWCIKHIGVELAVTSEKDYSMIEMWDDRSVPVEFNTGRSLLDEDKKTGILERAILYATEKHEGMFRKASDIPYIVHPTEAVSIAAGITSDPEVLAATVLHDVVEDTPTTMDEIKAIFGTRIAMLVSSDNEDKMPDVPPSESWEQRKEATIKYFESASRDEKILLLADKLSNIRSLSRDFSRFGDTVWEKFNQKNKYKHEWYYCEIARVTSDLSGSAAYLELCSHIDSIFKMRCDANGSDE